MNCPNCQTHNPEGAKFCFNCGTTLAITCRNCGTQLMAKAKFCFNCGTPVATTDDRQPTTGESINSQSEDSALARLQQYIPKELLGKLETARANRSMAGERRIVTARFCDVKG